MYSRAFLLFRLRELSPLNRGLRMLSCLAIAMQADFITGAVVRIVAAYN